MSAQVEVLQIYPGPNAMHIMDHTPTTSELRSLAALPCFVMNSATKVLYYCDFSGVYPMAAVWG